MEARESAYAPYSKYKVGSAVLTDQDEIFTGCNVENASYGLCICAERNAIFQAVAHGQRNTENKIALQAVAVVTQDIGSPCGACRQVIQEFMPKNGDVVILLADTQGNVKEFLQSELLAHPFSL